MDKNERIQRYIRVIAGSLITAGAVLGFLMNPYWLLLDLFVGLNLFQYGFTNWCLLERILRRIVKDGGQGIST